MPSASRIASDAQVDLNAILIEFREIALGVTLAAFTIALVVGLLAADPLAAGDDKDRKRVQIGGKPLGEEFVFRTSMELEQAQLWDRGVPSDLLADASRGPAGKKGQRRLSVGVWLELILCVVLDVAGFASYFFPRLGEFSDLGFSFVSAFILEIVFGWPELAIFNFWEEVRVAHLLSTRLEYLRHGVGGDFRRQIRANASD